MQAAMAAFLQNNPDIEEGTEVRDEAKPKAKDILHVFFEKKGRNGKVATFIEGFHKATPQEVEQLAKDLKKHLGVGGSFRDSEILVQGNLVDKVKEYLKQQGYKVK